MPGNNSTPSPISGSRLDEKETELTEDFDQGFDSADDILRGCGRGCGPIRT
jgi:hypothetical protein